MISTYPLKNVYTQLNQFQHGSLSNRLWLYGGILALLIFLFAYLQDKKRKPTLPKLHLSDYKLSPAEVSYFLIGIKEPASMLAASLLDLARRGYLDIQEEGLIFNDFTGPLLEHESYLLEWIQGIGNGRATTYKKIQSFRKKEAQEFFDEYQQWFQKLQEEIDGRELQYTGRANRGSFTAFISIGIVLLFIGFLGLKSGYMFALLTILSGVLFTGLALKNYGALPPKGQAVYQYFLPMEDIKNDTDLEDYNDMDRDNLFLYMLALGQSKDHLKLLEDRTYLYDFVFKSDPSFIKQIKDSFIGGVNFSMQ